MAAAGPRKPVDGPTLRGPTRPLQLDLFRDANAEVLKEIKRLKIEGLTPLEALNFLAKVRDKIV